MDATPMRGILAMSITISHFDKLTLDEAVPFLRIYPVQNDKCYLFIAKLLKYFKQPKCLLIKDLIKLWNIILCRCIGVWLCTCVYIFYVCKHLYERSKKKVAKQHVLCATICAYIYKQLWMDLQEMNYIGGFWRKGLGSWGTKAEVRLSLFILHAI